MTDKKILRKQILEQRGQIPAEIARAASDAIAKTLFSAPFYHSAESVFTYVSLANEPDTAPIIRRALADGKIVSLPRTKPGREMDVVPLESESAFRQAFSDWPRVYGIPEQPPEIPAIDPSKLDLVIVPSLVLDTDGYRLGYGGSYYDRFIARFDIQKKDRPLFVAIQYDMFILDKEAFAREPHDKSVDLIITEKRVIRPPLAEDHKTLSP